ncbi:NAD(P)/FAD-dependent oxidoreductase [Desulfonatronovibrio magnus]|uniref:NAD(P)/FAD-dependent oxidoreductase n=1 Tax=Desulfonatronovibrio magnus TaxID=698827 RepID=UPI0005EB513E|nr:FAD-dependent oxidoreductase [Desulfonatronovibrio magnus]
MTNSHTQNSIAVIGAGAAGISAAHYLSRKYSVDLYESGPDIGGHVVTVMADDNGSTIPVDMGFIVFNKRNYPCFCRLIQELNVESASTDMSFSYSEPGSGFAYSGHSLSALFASRTNIINPRFWKMLVSIARFNHSILKDLKAGSIQDTTLGKYVSMHGYHPVLFERYLEPMIKAIWSAEEEGAEKFPLKRFADFFANHGLLGIRDRPRWQYIKGGSHTYVKAFKKKFSGRVLTSTPVRAITRTSSGPEVHLDSGKFQYKAAVIACHADDALNLLHQPDHVERALLSLWQYTTNEVILHTDETFLPPNKRAWACWNYIAEPEKEHKKVNVHYWMNMLQNFKASLNHVVSLNPRTPVKRDRINHHQNMTHPCFTTQAVNSQSDLAQLQGRGGIYFCGSYHGNGFHEDAIASGVKAAQMLGVRI